MTINAAPRALLLAALLLSAATARADEPAAAGSGLRFNGYGTLGVVHTDISQPGWHFARDAAQKPDFGSLQTGTDTRLGLQVNWTLSSQFEAVAQAVLRQQDPDASAARAIDWAFLAWRPDADWTLRLGRTGPDIFLLSDRRGVGYTYPWARPSVEFYGWMPLPAIDGVDLQRAWRLGDADWRARVGAGSSSTLVGLTRYPGRPAEDAATRVDLRGIRFATVTREADGLTLKATWVRVRLTLFEARWVPLRAALDGLIGLGVPGVSDEAAAFRAAVDLERKNVGYAALAAAYETGPWQLSAELSRVSGQAKGANGLRSYVSLGWRHGELMPYAMLSRVRAAEPAAQTPTWAATLAPLIGPLAAADVQALAVGAAVAVNSTRFDQRSVALGLRWDLHPQMALKLQWERVRVGGGGAASWANVFTNEPATARVATVALDFVF